MNDAENQGGFYYIEVRPTAEYKTFRTLADTGEAVGIERVVGQRANGVWETVKWLIGKKSAHVENGKLVADDSDVRKLFDRLNLKPKHVEGNRFEAR